MKVVFLPAAKEELLGAIRYYNAQRSGLGGDFRKEVRAGIERIKGFPAAWHPLSENTRRYLLHRFPFALVDQIRDDKVVIVAVAHLHREPSYWSHRTDLE